jgi:tetratricopeptide (TPR) repeat protein
VLDAAVYAQSRPRPRRLLLPLLGLLALLAIGAGIAVATLGGGDNQNAAPPVSVKTVTQQGQTVQQTVTVSPPAPPTTAPATTAPATTAAAQSGEALNAQAYALMQRGDFAGARALLQQAVQALQGQTGNVVNGYANYNLGVTLIQLGLCADALPYLEAAKQLESDRHEVDKALKSARRCLD